MDFKQAVDGGLESAIAVMGEDFSIGGGVSSGIFDSLEMSATREPYGSTEEAEASIVFAELRCRPSAGLIIKRVETDERFKVLTFDRDSASITLHVKRLGKQSRSG